MKKMRFGFFTKLQKMRKKKTDIDNADVERVTLDDITGISLKYMNLSDANVSPIFNLHMINKMNIFTQPSIER